MAFESLKSDGVELAVHADINDKAQSVKLVEPPKETPKSPEPTPETHATATYTPKTGDEVPFAALVALALAGCCAMGVAMLARRKDKKATAGDAEAPDTYWQDLYREG